MATIYVRPTSKYFYVSYSKGGKCVRECTKVPHEGRSTPPKDSTVWELVRQIEDDMLRAKQGLPARLMPVLVDTFMRNFIYHLQGIKESSRNRLYLALMTFTNWSKANGVTWINEVTRAVTTQYVADRLRVVESATVKLEVTVLKRAINEARVRNHIRFDVNPFDIKIKVTSKKREPLTMEEIDLVLKANGEQHVVVAVIIGLFTGARLSSVAAIKWKDFSENLRTITFTESKTHQYTIPVHSYLAAYLDGICPMGEHVVNDVGNALTPERLGDQCNAWLKSIGVPKTFHCLRHTFVTLMAANGVEKRVAQLLSNHSSERIHDAYTHVDAASLTDQIEKIKVVKFRGDLEPACPVDLTTPENTSSPCQQASS